MAESTERYKITHIGTDYYFTLYISQTQEQLKQNITDIFIKHNFTLRDFDYTAGMFLPVIDGKNKSYGYMFLDWEDIQNYKALIAHECLHAAFAYERFVAKKIPYYGMQCGRKEERLAEMFSNIFTAVVDSIKKPTGGSKNV